MRTDFGCEVIRLSETIALSELSEPSWCWNNAGVAMDMLPRNSLGSVVKVASLLPSSPFTQENVSRLALSLQQACSLHEEVAVPKHFTLRPLLISVFGQVNVLQAAFSSQVRPVVYPLTPFTPEPMPV